MRAEQRRTQLISATVDIVAESGLSAFTVKKAADKVGVSEALVFKYFGTKDELLYASFESVHKSIGNMLAGLDLLSGCKSMEDVYRVVKTYWMTYFDFLVKNGNATLFYFMYRDSPYVNLIRDNDEVAKTTYFESFVGFFYAMDSIFHIYDKTSNEHLWTYVLDATGLFAKRVIRGELPDTPESRENVWTLISGGMLGLLQPPASMDRSAPGP